MEAVQVGDEGWTAGFGEERTAGLGRGTGQSRAELTVPAAPQIMRLKHKESQLCHGPGAKCLLKCSLPALSRVTQGKALFISA